VKEEQMPGKDENKELQALISLLDEPDEKIFETIRTKIFSFGHEAIPPLESAWENSFNPDIQHRIEEIIHKIQKEGLKDDLAKWSKDKSHDLLLGYMLISRFQYPDLSHEKIIKKIGQISQDVWLELNSNLTGLEKVKVINHILYDVNHFTGSVSNMTSPENYYINNLLDNKKGSPLALGLLYIIIAQSLKVQIRGVDLPRHFVLAYLDEPAPLDSTQTIDDVLFYINPFNKGAVFTKNEISLFIKQLKLEPKKAYYTPCDNPTIIRRLMNELIYIFEQSGNTQKAEELKELRDVV
jgi:regulator of sirC expression with transglutaminase-like and TPR domain